jgi:hypothetical protein
VVYEIGHQTFRFSRLRPLQTREEELPNGYFFITPDRKIHIGIRDALREQ